MFRTHVILFFITWATTLVQPLGSISRVSRSLFAPHFHSSHLYIFPTQQQRDPFKTHQVVAVFCSEFSHLALHDVLGKIPSPGIIQAPEIWPLCHHLLFLLTHLHFSYITHFTVSQTGTLMPQDLCTYSSCCLAYSSLIYLMARSLTVLRSLFKSFIRKVFPNYPVSQTSLITLSPQAFLFLKFISIWCIRITFSLKLSSFPD